MPDNTKSQVSLAEILVGGKALGPTDKIQLKEVVVEQDLHLPATFAIRLLDVKDSPTKKEEGYFSRLDADQFAVGKEVEIKLGREGTPATVLKGEITSLDIDIAAGGTPMLTVRGYDRAHRLHRHRKNRTFLNMSDADIVSKIAREHGLTPKTDSTPTKHDHVYQDNRTDWEFLRARASRIGFELFVDDKTLNFRKPAPQTSPVPAQKLGEGLQHVRMRLATPGQVDKVTVRDWDEKAKKAVKAEVTSATKLHSPAKPADGVTMAKKAFGSGAWNTGDVGVSTAGEAKTVATAIMNKIAVNSLQLEGMVLGNAKVRPGKTLQLKGVSERFDGTYYLTAATHKITPGDGYVVHFIVNGSRPNTLSSLLNGHGQDTLPGHPGVVVAVVTNNKDPDERGRVKVKFPWLSDSDESAWARFASPMTGGGRGFFFLPEVNDEVLVAFEHGDINRPYVVGSLWNGSDKSPKKASEVVDSTGKVQTRILKTRAGHTIILDDSDMSPSITIQDKTGGNVIKIDSKMNAISIKAKQDISIKAGANLSLEATGNLTLKGAVVKVEAQGQLDLKGKGLASLEAGGPLKIKGAIVNIN